MVCSSRTSVPSLGSLAIAVVSLCLGCATTAPLELQDPPVPAPAPPAPDPAPSVETTLPPSVFDLQTLAEEIVGRDLYSARRILAERGLGIKVVEGLARNENIVDRLEPSSGSVASGGDVGVVVRAVVVRIPNLLGQEVDHARQILQPLALSLEVTSRRTSSVSPGLIIEQSPRAESSAPFGSTVRIVVSTGPETIADQPVSTSAVPAIPDLATLLARIRSRLVDEAASILEEYGLGIDVVDEIFADGAAGTIWDLDPGLVEPLQPGSTVGVLVSRGPPPPPATDSTVLGGGIPPADDLQPSAVELGVGHWVAGGFGLLLLFVVLGLAVKFPHPSPFQSQVFRVVLGMAGAGLAVPVVALGGSIGVDAMKGAGIQAGGAIAIFVLIYMWNPAESFRDGGGRAPPGNTR